MGDARNCPTLPDSDHYTGLVLWDYESCDLREGSLEIVRKRLPRLAHELAIPEPYRSIRIEAFQADSSHPQVASGNGDEPNFDNSTQSGLIFQTVPCPVAELSRDRLNHALNNRMKTLKNCPKPVILVSGCLGTEKDPGPIRVAWELFGRDLVVVCPKPAKDSEAEKFLKDRLIRTYGWPPKIDRDFDSLLFHLDPAHEFPQGTNQVINPVVFVAGVTAVLGPVIYSVVNLVL